MEFTKKEPTPEEALSRYLQQYGYPYTCRIFGRCKNEFRAGFLAGYSCASKLSSSGLVELYAEYADSLTKKLEAPFANRQGFESGILYGAIRHYKLTMVSRL
jgi:hypothetical protein